MMAWRVTPIGSRVNAGDDMPRSRWDVIFTDLKEAVAVGRCVLPTSVVYRSSVETEPMPVGGVVVDGETAERWHVADGARRRAQFRRQN